MRVRWQSESNEEDVRMRQIQALCTNLYIHYIYMHRYVYKKFFKVCEERQKKLQNESAFKGGIPIYIQMPPAHETSEPLNVMFVLIAYKTLPFPLT